MRVYEAAKLLGISSKEALNLLLEAGFGPYTTHMVVLPDREVEYLESRLKNADSPDQKEQKNKITV